MDELFKPCERLKLTVVSETTAVERTRLLFTSDGPGS